MSTGSTSYVSLQEHLKIKRLIGYKSKLQKTYDQVVAGNSYALFKLVKRFISITVFLSTKVIA